MMKLRLLPYFLRQAVVNIMSNRSVHFVSMGTMMVSLLIFGAFLLLFVNANKWVEGWGHSLSMSVYLEDEINETEKNQIAAVISGFPGAQIKRVISKKEALGDLRKTLGLREGLLEGLSRNPLPASFEVIFRDTDPVAAQEIKKRLEILKGVDEVLYSEQWMHRFEGFINLFRLVGFVLGGLLSLGVLFIVTNTIKLTIYARKDEIEILKLVGATDWFVKTPFMLEGMIQGLLSSVLALVILFSAYVILAGKKMQLIGLAMLDFSFLPPEHMLSILLVSVVLGLVGSFIAVGHFFEI